VWGLSFFAVLITEHSVLVVQDAKETQETRGAKRASRPPSSTRAKSCGLGAAHGFYAPVLSRFCGAKFKFREQGRYKQKTTVLYRRIKQNKNAFFFRAPERMPAKNIVLSLRRFQLEFRANGLLGGRSAI
jgi:hypothetical protein